MADNSLNKNMYSNFSNNPVDNLNYWKTNQDDLYYKSTLSQNHSGDFRAVILSGFVAGDNTGAGIDRNDAKIVTASDSSERFFEITVFPLDFEGSAWLDIRDYDNFEDISRVIAMTSTLYRARCEHNYEATKDSKLLFGHIITCFYEGNDSTKLRFRSVTSPTSDQSFLQLYNLTGLKSALSAFRTSAGITALLGEHILASSPTEIAEKARKYDNSLTLPNRSNHSSRFSTEMHPEFVPYAKAVIFDLWDKKKITVAINSTFRTVGKQRQFYNKHNAWVGRKQAAEAAGTPFSESQPYAAAPAVPGTSKHNFGTAMDFNIWVNGIKLGSKKIGTKKEDWIASGAPDIIESLGLVWGGRWGNYDPIHLHLDIPTSVKTKIVKASGNIVDKRAAVLAIAAISLK